MFVNLKLRKIGPSSKGFIIPAELIREKNFQEGQTFKVQIEEINPFKEVFGIAKSNVDIQAFKDEMRKEELEAEKRKYG